jgi:ornithine cyclodeaminase/alanine dehydrogenase-like protein (mu-crystallin family)
VKIRVLSARDVHELLPYDECAAVMRAVLAALARGELYQPLRTVLRPPGAAGLMALMPAYAAAPAETPAGPDSPGTPGTPDGPGSPGMPDGAHAGAADPAGVGAYGLKAICITPGNPARGKDTHQGGVLVFGGDTGELLALVNASALTEIRTAAVSAVATSLLARPDASELAVIGAGVQGRAHLLAITAEHPVTSARIAARDLGRTRDLAAEMTDRLGIAVTACETPEEAVAGAGIVVTATTSAQPVLRRQWLAAGTHVNAVGACVPDARELDTATMADAALFADRRESVLSEAGDYTCAAREGAIGPGHIRAELGEILAGTAPGRVTPEEITVFESLGLAAEDLAAALHVARKAAAGGAGTLAEFLASASRVLSRAFSPDPRLHPGRPITVLSITGADACVPRGAARR